MYDLLELYARPYRAQEPVICIDEKSKQLIGDSRAPLPMKPAAPAKYDYEYIRKGTCDVFVAVEPKAGRRVATHRPGRFIWYWTISIPTSAPASRRCWASRLPERCCDAFNFITHPSTPAAQHGRD
ncbi:MAG: hypothetical protein ACT4P3_01340 [Betaproteobacteria bacterium]